MNTAVRYQTVDALRGLAILLMVIYHFCYDLSYFKLADFDFYHDPFWLHSRTFILSLFLVLVGISLWLAHAERIRPVKALKRAGIIAVNAALVSLATWVLFGERVVFFGVLHFIVVASLLGLLFVRHRWAALVAGLWILGMNGYANSWFDRPWHQWIGMMTHKPATEDYVPLVPWLGVVLTGIFVSKWVQVISRRQAMPSAVLQPVAFLGRHSLLIYMLHQPLLIGGLKLLTSGQAM